VDVDVDVGENYVCTALCRDDLGWGGWVSLLGMPDRVHALEARMEGHCMAVHGGSDGRFVAARVVP
jgi:hypothetical protein